MPPVSLRPPRDHAQRVSSRFHSLLLVLCALLLPWAAARAELDPALAKKVAKLASKLIARQVKLDEHQDVVRFGEWVQKAVPDGSSAESLDPVTVDQSR